MVTSTKSNFICTFDNKKEVIYEYVKLNMHEYFFHFNENSKKNENSFSLKF